MQDLTQELNSTGLTNGTSLNLGNTAWLGTLLMVGTIVSIVLTVVFVIYLIVNIAHRWKSEKAMVAMAKDIHDIKTLLEEQTAPKPSVAPVETTQPTE